MIRTAQHQRGLHFASHGLNQPLALHAFTVNGCRLSVEAGVLIDSAGDTSLAVPVLTDPRNRIAIAAFRQGAKVLSVTSCKTVSRTPDRLVFDLCLSGKRYLFTVRPEEMSWVLVPIPVPVVGDYAGMPVRTEATV